MRKIKILSCLHLLCLPVAALAQGQPDVRWSPVVQSHQGRIFIDRSTLQREGDLRTVLAHAIPTTVFQGMASADVLMRFDCAGRRYTLLRLRAFRSDGSELADTEMPNGATMGPVGLDADTVALFEAVCAL